MSRNYLLPAVMIVMMIVTTGCADKKEIIDLNKVLDIMVSTLDEMKDMPMDGAKFNGEELQPIAMEAENAENLNQFANTFAHNLNQAKLISDPIGVEMNNDGALSGFKDKNSDGQKDGNENQIFTVEIDSERGRLIATDTQNSYRRDHGFSMAGGLFTGYLLGSMLGRQNRAGIGPSRFSNMKMSPKNYHSTASSGSARSKSGSRSFKGGK